MRALDSSLGNGVGIGGDSGIEGPDDSEGTEEIETTGDTSPSVRGGSFWLSGFSLDPVGLVAMFEDVASLLSPGAGGRTGKTHFVPLSRHCPQAG